jgi:hypothetical protein
MKTKLRLTIIVEYEADSYDYGTEDPYEMAKIDESNFMPYELDFFLENCTDNGIKVEPVTEG